MLRVCVMEHQGSWDKNLLCVEYQESMKMTLFEVLYVR
jgi:hypothetical protein